MTKKDYERAAEIAQDCAKELDPLMVLAVVDAFAAFFGADNPRFDEVRFRIACEVGANVKAKGGRE